MPEMTDRLYHYKADVTKVHDGDTCTVDLHLGFGLKHEEIDVRWYGIDAPERYGLERVEGLKVGAHVRDMILNQEVVIQTFPDKRGKDRAGKYGRPLAVIWWRDRNLNAYLLDQGLARVETYGDPIPEWAIPYV